jgi:hypothetical protein
MLSRKNLVVLIAAMISITACSSNKTDSNKPGFSKVRIDSEGIKNDRALSSSEKAEKLALAAEQLVTAQSFMYANEVADAALAVDANNKRAQLIKNLIAPAMEMKGILTRIKPLAERNAESKAEYDKAILNVSKIPNSAIKKFLMDNGTPIKNENQAQTVISGVQQKWTGLRMWLKANKNIEMSLNIPAEYSEQAIRTQIRDCDVQVVETGVYDLECDLSGALTVKLNQADLEAAQQIVAGNEIMLNLYNGYNLSGSIAIADKYKNQRGVTKLVIDDLLRTSEFGVLRDGQGIRNILSMGLDAVAGIRYAQKIQSELCPRGEHAKGNRKGYLFKEGLCVQQDNATLGNGSSTYQTFGDLMKTIELALNGSNITQTFRGRLGEIETEIKPSAIFANPIQNVRSLTPLRYDRCGKVVGTRDATLGGVFVNGDANAVLLLSKDSCLQ